MPSIYGNNTFKTKLWTNNKFNVKLLTNMVYTSKNSLIFILVYVFCKKN